MIIAADETKILDITWPHPISLLSAIFTCETIHNEDTLEVQIAPDTVTGTITEDVPALAGVIKVSQTVIDNVAIGYYIKLSDGTNTDDLGRVTAIDTATKEITVETLTVNAFLVATPTYIKQTVKMSPIIKLGGCGTKQIGSSKIGGSYLPANTSVRVIYKETSSVAKKFYFIMESLY